MIFANFFSKINIINIRNIKHITWLLFSLLISACMMGPNYVRPKIDVPLKFKEAPKGWKVAQPQDAVNRGEWWKVFQDHDLDRLEKKLIISNQTIAVAAAQYQQAISLVDEANASFFPTLAGTVNVTRQRQAGGGSTSFTSTSASGGTSAGTAVTGVSSPSGARSFTTHSWVLNAMWEPDLWGSIRRTVEASVAGAQASGAQLASIRLSSQATLAQTYFQMRALDEDQKILDQTVAEYKKALTVTQNRYNSGVAARTDVAQAQSQLESAEALAFNNRINRAKFEHAIAVLLGEAPADFSFPAKPLTTKPPAIPLEVPSVLLERRPDVAQAERLVAQANAQIGVAIAAYFPNLALNASASESNSNYAHWFSVPALNWSLGPQLAETIFDGGLRRAVTAAARANYEATVATYRQTVLTSFQDVEDNLVSLRVLKQQWEAEKKAAESADLALKLITNQYKAGTVAYTDVITAQTTAFTAEKSVADIAGLRMTAAVGLIKALGGSWNGNLE